MKLNKTSYTHVQIRTLCQILEQTTGTKLVTNLDEEFEELRFVGRISYIVIDYQKKAIFTLSHHLTEHELNIAQDIIIYLRFLYTVGKAQDTVQRLEREEKKKRGA